VLKPQLRLVHAENLDVYGARKVWLQIAERASQSVATGWPD